MAYYWSIHPERSRTATLTATAVVLAAHAAVIAALWQLAPTRVAPALTPPVLVTFVEPPRPKVEPAPKPLPAARPMPARPRPKAVANKPVLAAASEAPAPAVVAPPAPTPAQAAEVAPTAPAPAAATPAAQPPQAVVVTAPRFNADYLNNPAPAYPALSRRMGEEGKVVLRVRVSERGLPDEVHVRNSSGSERLDTTALETVRRWKFVPARRGDTPVEAWVLVPISFSLRS